MAEQQEIWIRYCLMDVRNGNCKVANIWRRKLGVELAAFLHGAQMAFPNLEQPCRFVAAAEVRVQPWSRVLLSDSSAQAIAPFSF
jgi:hypothetical protein